ncbi:oxidoreductase [Actinorhabdospora filicis]|uniref:Oxidoreductase n=1 Tax=Actinorhabdospora filicis TaxID=1785913 RepID=A0A9W6WCD0_9ACTN|nr:SDR family NAD(P)-dependent oxidoreductase [Actinorhabdospora filicis]GLZ79655.1 oxidoreductase [Actinorhabdospora filicis]
MNEENSVEAGIDPARMEICMSVLAEVRELPGDHPDSIAVRRATAGIYKAVKQGRRRDKRAAVTAADAEVTSRTATGAPDRIDDETQGVLLEATATSETVGFLQRARSCYICKDRYREVDAFYHQLCPTCAKENWSRRDIRVDLTGRRALLTGGRAKIGMYIALRLLRDGAHTTITTRFPNDAVRRFKAMEDSGDWMHRLKIVGIDLRDPAQVVALADDVAAAGPLDILINNAAQTVRRSPGAYKALIEAEAAELPSGALPELVSFGGVTAKNALAIAASTEGSPHALTPQMLTSLALTSGSASAARIETGLAVDAGGLVPDLVSTNSWVQVVDEVDPVELLEVQLCNQTAPFILVSRLRSALRASTAHRKYVVNVSAMEGVFSRGYKGPGHPHTNMAKAALNMLTRTSAREMLSDGILMTAVDTGWITDERPHTQKMRLHEEGFHAPLDLVDGAARVYDPIVRGEAGEDLSGVFLKDFKPSNW